MEIVHKVKPISLGIAIGKVLKFQRKKINVEHYCIFPDDIEDEVSRFENAVDKSYTQILDIKDKVENELGESYAKIFEAHLLLLKDPFFVNEITNRIRTEKINAEYILNDTLKIINDSFKNLDNEISRERAIDIYDVGRRVLQNLTNVSDSVDSENKNKYIIVAEELLPSDTLHIAENNILGFVTSKGGKTSHTAILARALKVPAVVDENYLFEKVIDDEKIILNALSAEVILNPESSTLEYHIEKQQQYYKSEELLLKKSLAKCITKDEIKINFFSNIEFVNEASEIKNYGAEGIGLFRTEFLFMDKVRLPTEEEQFLIYKSVVEKNKDLPVVIRTLDIGGDKLLLSGDNNHESNPFLGLRAIRYCLKHPNIFKEQLRAIIRASKYGKIKILIPMVSFISEILETKKIIDNIKFEFQDENVDFSQNIEFGVMIETPASVSIINEIAKNVDFVSIGTNDLTQYTLAVDRANDNVNHLFQTVHPAVIKMLKIVIDSAKKNKIGISVCGDMAGIPTTAILLLGMGLTDFSMSSASIPDIKTIFSEVTVKQSKKFVDDIMKFNRVKDIKNYIRKNIVPIVVDIVPSYKEADLWLI